jgi:hypothetical protein
MSKADEAKAREQRLAAKLRENLKRRKQAARDPGQGASAGKGEAPRPPEDSGKG